MAKGFVYVLSNAAYQGLLKIGFSRKVPDGRAAELDTTGVPSPFVVEYYCLVEGDAELEGQVHGLLNAKRHRKDREFFRVEVNEAIVEIQRVCPSPEYVWSRVPFIPPTKARPSMVKCLKCGASYVVAEYCPKCQVKLEWSNVL